MSRTASTRSASAGRPGTASSEYALGAVELARRVVEVLGGRYSTELGIDVDGGEAEVERWFVAATLFGARIPARVPERAFGVLAAAGLARIGQMRHVPSDDLIAMLDAPVPGTTSGCRGVRKAEADSVAFITCVRHGIPIQHTFSSPQTWAGTGRHPKLARMKGLPSP